jgi:VWFA-related protein
VSRLYVISLSVLLALVAVVLRAQDQPTFRTGANYVRVDMYATVDGKSIEDLTAEEVEVLEDGVAQKVEAFEHVRVSPAGPQETRREPNTVEQSRQMAAEGRARVFVIFLDTYHTTIEGSANMRLPLVKFLDRLLGPEDMVALMTPEMGASEITLGRKTTVISNIMQAEWMWGRKGRLNDTDSREDMYDACYGLSGGPSAEMKARRREKLSLDALSDLMVHLAGVREERKALIVVSEGWQLFKANPNLTTSRDDDPNRVRPEDVLRRTPRPTPSDSDSSNKSNIRVECEADRLALASLDHTQRLREITDDANRGNVTFYPVYARGLVAFDAPIGPEKPPSVREDQANLRVKQDGLRFLADNTDGTSIINTNNIDGMLQRIVDDLSSYYLFGYYSTNTKLDGRFRNITVRVKRPGVKVRARRGYRGRTADELISGAAGAAATEASNTLTTALTPVVSFNARSQFRIRASSWARQATGSEPSDGAFWVVAELDYRTRRELAWTASAKADVVVLASDGKEIMSKTLEVRTDDGPFAFSVPDSGGLVAGEYAVRVRLTSSADSGQVLSDTVRVVLNQASNLGEAVLWRRGPTTGLQHRRTADPRFLRSERLRLEHATMASGAATARLLDRNGNPLNVPVQVTERDDGAGGFRWIVVDASLAPLAAGDYAIEVTQGKAKQVTGFRVVP